MAETQHSKVLILGSGAAGCTAAIYASRAMLERKNAAFSGIFGPDGRLISEPLIDVEGIAYADIDINRCIQPKQMHDIIGHYNRFDIFDLRVNRAPQAPLALADEATRQERLTPPQGLLPGTGE